MSDTVIATGKLTKHFGKVRAVEEISLNVKKGEIYGLIGLNGAGKTTLIRMLLGMIRPVSGASFINGKKVRAGNHDLWKSIGYMVEIPYSYPELTVRENLEIARRLRLLKNKSAVDNVMTKLKLEQYSARIAKHLSLGNSQRLGLAKALIHSPEILILDEPSNGLDPAGIVEIRELLQNLAYNEGITIFISSHILGELSRFASRIGIIHEGRLLQELDSEELDRIRRKRLHIDSLDRPAVKTLLEKQGYQVKLTEEDTLEIDDERAVSHPEQIAALMVNSGLPPVLLKVDEEDLESYFLRIVGSGGGKS